MTSSTHKIGAKDPWQDGQTRNVLFMTEFVGRTLRAQLTDGAQL